MNPFADSSRNSGDQECGADGSAAPDEANAAQRSAPHSFSALETASSEASDSFSFKPLDKTNLIEKTRRFLPHWAQEGCTYFVTYRLADSFPQSVLREWQAEMDLWLSFNPKPWDAVSQREYNKRFEGPRQKWLDAGHGSCVLRDPALRGIVADGFHHFDSQRYDLGDYVIMPNHVHVLVTPRAGWRLKRVLHTWKSYSGHEILRRTGGEPPFWLQESFDHIVRSERQLEHYRNYIRENPSKAKLRPGKFTYYEREGAEESGADRWAAERGAAGLPATPPQAAAQRSAPHSCSPSTC